MVFEWLKNKIPHCNFVKARDNDDMLIICAESLSLYYFNSTAKFFIGCVDGKNTVADIKNKFLDKYEVAEHEVENDISEIIRDLQWKKILTLE